MEGEFVTCPKCNSDYWVNSDDVERWGSLTFLCPICRRESPLAALTGPQVSPRLMAELEEILVGF